MTTYRITEHYEPENHDVVFTIEGLPAYAFGRPVEPSEDESFRVRPYDRKMVGLQKKHADDPRYRYRDQAAFQVKYGRQMMQNAGGAVYLVGDNPALTKPYAVFAGLYDITQTHDLIHSGDRFIYRMPGGDTYEFILEGAWIEGSPGGRAAMSKEKTERLRRGFASSKDITDAIWPSEYGGLSGRLPSEIDTERIADLVEDAFEACYGVAGTAFFEHGHWWIEDDDDRIYDVVDAAPGCAHGFDFEEVG